MNKQEILSLLNATPFSPFRIVMTDGTQYEITHPDQVMAGASKLIVGIGRKGPHEVEEFAHCSLLHITQLVEAA